MSHFSYSSLVEQRKTALEAYWIVVGITYRKNLVISVASVATATLLRKGGRVQGGSLSLYFTPYFAVGRKETEGPRSVLWTRLQKDAQPSLQAPFI